MTERIVRVPVFTLRNTEAEAKTVQRIRELAGQGLGNGQIATQLNAEKFLPCRGPSFTRQIVANLRSDYGIISNREKACRGELSWAYTFPEMARLIGVDPSWFSRKISEGRIRITLDPRYHCYLLPRNQKTLRTMMRLKNREVPHVSFPRVHYDG